MKIIHRIIPKDLLDSANASKHYHYYEVTHNALFYYQIGNGIS